VFQQKANIGLEGILDLGNLMILPKKLNLQPRDSAKED